MKKNRLQRIFNRLLTLGVRKKLLSPQHAVDNHAADNHSEHEEVIPTFIVKGASMSRIDDMEGKQFWERKYTKDVLKAKTEWGWSRRWWLHSRVKANSARWAVGWSLFL